MTAFSPFLLPVTLLAVAGSGLVAGLLFAFSNFVMKALTRLPAQQGMHAMQLINVTIINRGFLLLFLGTALLCAFLLLASLLQWQSPAALWLLIGSAFYLLGPLGITMAFNVPLNNALAATESTSPDAAREWASYVAKWLRWNHVRTLMAIAAILFLTFAASQIPGVNP